MVESHSPRYIGDEGLTSENIETVVGLFTDDETPEAMAEGANV